MSKLVLWGIEASPPTRAVKILLKLMNLDYEFERVNLLEGEHYKNELIKHNPKPTVPCLQDGEVFLFESHAISAYLVDKFAESDELYPKDLAKRAVVEKLLYFDVGVLFPALVAIVGPYFYKKKTLVEEEKLDNVTECYKVLETLLQNDYLTGENLTIADISAFTSIRSLDVFVPLKAENFPKINAWLLRLENLPNFKEINENGLHIYSQLVKPNLTYIWN